VGTKRQNHVLACVQEVELTEMLDHGPLHRALEALRAISDGRWTRYRSSSKAGARSRVTVRDLVLVDDA
jgi:hypothetical protein